MHGNNKEARKEKATLAEQGLKKCGLCKIVKPYEKFPPIAPSVRWPGDGYKTNCRKCETAYVVNLHNENRRILEQIKVETGCIICGYNEEPTLLHWHHREPDEKLFNISNKSNAYTFKELIAETKKCDVMCKPCHIEHHHP